MSIHDSVFGYNRLNGFPTKLSLPNVDYRGVESNGIGKLSKSLQNYTFLSTDRLLMKLTKDGFNTPIALLNKVFIDKKTKRKLYYIYDLYDLTTRTYIKSISFTNSELLDSMSNKTYLFTDTALSKGSYGNFIVFVKLHFLEKDYLKSVHHYDISSLCKPIMCVKPLNIVDLPSNMKEYIDSSSQKELFNTDKLSLDTKLSSSVYTDINSSKFKNVWYMEDLSKIMD